MFSVKYCSQRFSIIRQARNLSHSPKIQKIFQIQEAYITGVYIYIHINIYIFIYLFR